MSQTKRCEEHVVMWNTVTHCSVFGQQWSSGGCRIAHGRMGFESISNWNFISGRIALKSAVLACNDNNLQVVSVSFLFSR